MLLLNSASARFLRFPLFRGRIFRSQSLWGEGGDLNFVEYTVSFTFKILN